MLSLYLIKLIMSVKNNIYVYFLFQLNNISIIFRGKKTPLERNERVLFISMGKHIGKSSFDWQHGSALLCRLFADDTKESTKIKSQDDTEHLQQDINKTYTWTDEKLMEFSENKFEQKSQSDTKIVGKGKYKTKTGQIIEENKSV